MKSSKNGTLYSKKHEEMVPGLEQETMVPGSTKNLQIH